jgi:hypothetical protein
MGALLPASGDGFADATAGAGNEGNLAVEVEQVGLGHAVFLVVGVRGSDLAMTCRLICSSSGSCE